eukprot:357999-Chlamydomonas_euryale.AAC.3
MARCRYPPFPCPLAAFSSHACTPTYPVGSAAPDAHPPESWPHQSARPQPACDGRIVTTTGPISGAVRTLTQRSPQLASAFMASLN